MKWEYKAIVIISGAIIEDVLNEFGMCGWELVTMDNSNLVAYFKRQKQ